MFYFKKNSVDLSKNMVPLRLKNLTSNWQIVLNSMFFSCKPMCTHLLLIVAENNASWMCRHEVKSHVHDHCGNTVYPAEICPGENEAPRGKCSIAVSRQLIQFVWQQTLMLFILFCTYKLCYYIQMYLRLIILSCFVCLITACGCFSNKYFDFFLKT